MHPDEAPEGVWKTISADIIGPLPLSGGFNTILMVIGWLSNMVHAIPTDTKVTTEHMAYLYHKHIWKHHGIPEKVITGWGPQFASCFMTELLKVLGSSQNLSTAYHLQMDVQTEHLNQDIKQYLCAYIAYQQDNWHTWLNTVEFIYNNQEHAIMEQTLFFLNYSYHPWLGDPVSKGGVNNSANHFIAKMTEIRKEAQASITLAGTHTKIIYDKKWHHSLDYQPGDQVWLEGTNIKMKHPLKKLNYKWYGPFKVKSKKGLSTYELELPLTWQIYPVFNEMLLTLYKPPTFDIQCKDPEPPPELIKGFKEHEVEEIWSTKKLWNKTVYLVYWAGTKSEGDTWEPLVHLTHAQEAIAKYYQKYPLAIW